jgi:hypothetical protein
MGLAQLVYRSTAAESAAGMERMMTLRHIHARAMEVNKRNDVTGFLAFTMKHFIQVLEGDRATVTATYDRIVRDRRHKNIELLGITHCPDRIFGRWAMGAIFDEEIIKEAMRTIRASGELDITTLAARDAVEVLRVMSERHGSETANTPSAAA